MATIRNYAKSGSINWSVTSPVPQGGLCYVGDGKFATASQNVGVATYNINLLSISNKGATLDKTIAAYTGVAGTGAPVSLDSNRGGKLVLALRQDTGGPAARRYHVRCIDIANAGQDWQVTISDSLAEGGICFNGCQWWCSYVNTSLSNQYRFDKLDIAGNTASIARSISLGNAVPSISTYCLDMCYDGLHLFTIQGSNCVVYEVAGRQPPTQQDSFALTGANPLGIATDGNSLYVLSRN